ncbi:MAG: hypothetical protein AB1512_09455 [Thermodesulfobacteriota bacterium]
MFVKVIVLSWMILSIIYWTYWHLNPETKEPTRTIAYITLTGTLFGIGALVGLGLDVVLAFIPDNEFRELISYSIGLMVGLGYIYALGRKKVLEDGNTDLQREVMSARRKNKTSRYDDLGDI